MYNLEIITFDRVLPVWQDHLWPDRKSPIEPVSAMCYLSNQVCLQNMTEPVVFLGIIYQSTIVGVNSVHRCVDNTARSRGLWVDTKHRGQGLGQILLTASAKHAAIMSCDFLWSFPRKTSWPTYQSAGFIRSSEWILSETSPANAYARRNLFTDMINIA